MKLKTIQLGLLTNLYYCKFNIKGAASPFMIKPQIPGNLASPSGGGDSQVNTYSPQFAEQVAEQVGEKVAEQVGEQVADQSGVSRDPQADIYIPRFGPLAEPQLLDDASEGDAGSGGGWGIGSAILGVGSWAFNLASPIFNGIKWLFY